MVMADMRRKSTHEAVFDTLWVERFEVSVEFFMEYSVILQRFPLYSTYKGFNFIDERSTFISSNEWRNTYESISYR